MKFNDNFLSFYKKLISGPDDPMHDYLLSGYTYGMIYELAAGIADHFRNESREMTVCLCTENKAFIVASLLASIAGGPDIMLPYSYAGNVIEEMRDYIGFEYLLTDMTDEIRSDAKTVLLNQISRIKKPLTIKREPDSLFLKLFTGGSTGKPKVWNKTPENIFSEALYHSNKFNMNSNDIVLSTVPPHHIYGLLFSVLMPFVSGAKAVDKMSVLPSEIISNIRQYSATILISIPMHYRALKGSSISFPSLKYALSSGGSLDFEDAGFFHERTGLEVLEIFGSTETGGIATRYNSGSDVPWKIMDNKSWKIISNQLSIKSNFISPDVQKDNDDYFITGDRVEKIDDNSFRHLGRSDGVIKVAGKRVDLDEVENVLKKIPGIIDAVIIAVPVTSSRENEIAAIIEGNVDQAYVRQSAIRMLESYAVPRKIRIVEKIPVLPTGKYDRQKIQSILAAQD